jgi:hypothetical protein
MPTQIPGYRCLLIFVTLRDIYNIKMAKRKQANKKRCTYNQISNNQQKTSLKKSTRSQEQDLDDELNTELNELNTSSVSIPKKQIEGFPTKTELFNLIRQIDPTMSDKLLNDTINQMKNNPELNNILGMNEMLQNL